LARRNRLIEPVVAAPAADTALGYRARKADAADRAKNPQHQEVKASVKRQQRFRMEPVKHTQNVRA
jgi:hypothetical protein